MTFQRCFSGAPWEPLVGYCRAVRAGDFIAVSGTAPVAADGSVHAPGDAYEQAKHCLHLIEQALNDLGAGLTDVVRTRLYVTAAERDWQLIARAHRETFGDHPPACTMVEVKGLIDPAMLIEIEADAVVQ